MGIVVYGFNMVPPPKSPSGVVVRLPKRFRVAPKGRGRWHAVSGVSLRNLVDLQYRKIQNIAVSACVFVWWCLSGWWWVHINMVVVRYEFIQLV